MIIPRLRLGAASILGLLLLAGALPGLAPEAGAAENRPNILWLTWEDAGPHLGCYGDRYASTPNLDALAARGMRYRRVWSVVPVWAPARTAIISGMYPCALGAEHMRSDVPLPEGVRMFPQYLRDAGYYCSNNSKEDYNLRKPDGVWDDSSNQAHWRNRAPGQPFFAVFNFTESHESQVRRRPHEFEHDPARAPVPPYMPDVPEVREAWAQYYDRVSAVDRRVGAALQELADAGLEQDTIILCFGDHGPGLPRSKRSACDSGLRVPLIVYFPERWRHLAPDGYAPGSESTRLVSFVDLAPTMLSLAGIRPPARMQGRAFAGWYEATPREFLHGMRARMDERYDLVRSVTDGRHVYIRNYLPHLPHGQHVAYMFETPATRAWHRLHTEGRLTPAQDAYWSARPPEELYDLEADPHETINLASSAAHRPVLERLRAELRQHTFAVGDYSFLPEADMIALAAGGSPTRISPDRYDVRRAFEAAERAARRDAKSIPELRSMTAAPDAAVRYWGAVGLLVRGADAVRAARDDLMRLLDDPSPSVRVAAAEALATHGRDGDADRAVNTLLQAADLRQSEYLVAVAALNAIDRLGPRMGDRRAEMTAFPRRAEGVSPRMNDYAERLLTRILAE